MKARDWFEQIRADVLECAALEKKVLELNHKAGPRGQTFEASGRGAHAGDGGAAVLRAVQAEEDLDRMRAVTNAKVDRALAVLYGEDNHGGLAKARTSADADCICGYYLMGMSWREVAEEIARPDSVNPRHWCTIRAHRALTYIDEIGMDALAKGCFLSGENLNMR